MVATHEKMLELGLESPFESWWFRRPWQDFRITTRVDVATVYQRKKAALLAHATQIDPDSPFWFALPDDVAATVHPCEEYHLARSTAPVELPEHDLFAGLRAACLRFGRHRRPLGRPTVAKYLTQEWLDLQRELATTFPEKPGVSARMQYVVTGGPDGDVAYYTVIDDGRIVENGARRRPRGRVHHDPVLRRLGAGAARASSTPTPPSCRAGSRSPATWASSWR